MAPERGQNEMAQRRAAMAALAPAGHHAELAAAFPWETSEVTLPCGSEAPGGCRSIASIASQSSPPPPNPQHHPTPGLGVGASRSLRSASCHCLCFPCLTLDAVHLRDRV